MKDKKHRFQETRELKRVTKMTKWRKNATPKRMKEYWKTHGSNIPLRWLYEVEKKSQESLC